MHKDTDGKSHTLNSKNAHVVFHRSVSSDSIFRLSFCFFCIAHVIYTCPYSQNTFGQFSHRPIFSVNINHIV